MKANDLPCLGEEASMYIGWETHKPEGNFTFELVLLEDKSYTTFPDNPVCNNCKYALECVKELVEALCSDNGSEVLGTFFTQ